MHTAMHMQSEGVQTEAESLPLGNFMQFEKEMEMQTHLQTNISSHENYYAVELHSEARTWNEGPRPDLVTNFWPIRRDLRIIIHPTNIQT